jgi:hypothetical protein
MPEVWALSVSYEKHKCLCPFKPHSCLTRSGLLLLLAWCIACCRPRRLTIWSCSAAGAPTTTGSSVPEGLVAVAVDLRPKLWGAEAEPAQGPDVPLTGA